MLQELAESDATGDIKEIYQQIRDLTGVPYVSSLQRHLATRPGWLEWAWSAIGPVFHSGIAQKTSWRIAAGIKLQPLQGIAQSTWQSIGLDDHAVAEIRNVCNSFIRVSPTNLAFSAMMLRLLDGEQSGGSSDGVQTAFNQPEHIAPLPSLVDPTSLPAEQLKVLDSFTTQVNDQAFIPGIYRMLAHWPEFLAAVETQLVPRFSDSATQDVCHWLAVEIDRASPDVFKMTAVPELPPADLVASMPAVRNAIMRYRQTSPEMVVYGTLIRDLLD